jgi:hypothetical protein
LIALLRHQDTKNFEVVIHVNHNRWTVNLEDQDVGTVRTGSGATPALRARMYLISAR